MSVARAGLAAGTPAAFDDALAEIDGRITALTLHADTADTQEQR